MSGKTPVSGTVAGGAKAICRQATMADLEQLWDENIAQNPGDARWVQWKREYIALNRDGRGATFAVVLDGVPVGEGTLLFSPDCSALAGRRQLADGDTVANVNALRIRPAYEGQGHISALMRCIERHAAAAGCRRLTIGVEAAESRNLAIYLYWGYTRFILSEVEDGALVLYYAKDL